MSEPVHGVGQYRRGCRCGECRRATADAHRAWSANNRAHLREQARAWREANPETWAEVRSRHRAKALSELADPRDPRHGREGTYGIGCRCDRCREAHTVAARERRARKQTRARQA